MKSFRSFAVALVAALASQAALAADAPKTYVIDASHSNAGFEIKHLFSKVYGEIRGLEGEFTFDPAKPETSKGSFSVPVAKIDTDNAKRDEHLRSADFFDAEKHPKITFESAGLKKAGKDKYKMPGKLTIRGVTKDVTFDVDYLGAGADPWGNFKAGFTAVTKINRKDYGVNWNKTLDKGGLLLGEEVALKINVEADAKKAEGAAEKK